MDPIRHPDADLSTWLIKVGFGGDGQGVAGRRVGAQEPLAQYLSA
jgi:hypothetical protein